MHSFPLPYAATHRFSDLVLDHVAGDSFFNGFRDHSPDLEGLKNAAKARGFAPGHRQTLLSVLRRQYEGIDISGPVEANLNRLAEDRALTVTTGHQLCLFTGPLYMPLKILNTIRLARELEKELSRPVVPVFWMATEDHDRAEIDHAWFGDQRLDWSGAHGGAVGQLTLNGIEPIVEQACALLGAGPDAEGLRMLLRASYRPERTLATATRHIVHALFGRYGLVCLDGDDRALKQLFVPVMREELLNAIGERTVRYADERLKERYRSQAHPRPINLFHLRPGHRVRIERSGEHFQALQGGPRFTLDEILLDLELRPQDYSPNVLLRPLYQETVLPNIAYIGGGGELAYWMQLKWLFQSVQLPMPVVLLRTSMALLTQKSDALRGKLGLSVEELFLPEHDLMNRVARQSSGVATSLKREHQELDALFKRLAEHAASIDPTLSASAAAAGARAERLVSNFQGKLDRALRRKEADRLRRVQTLLEELFPGGGLQERRLCILPLIATHGMRLLDELLEHLHPLDTRFTLLVEE